jgi:hypothetical protein
MQLFHKNQLFLKLFLYIISNQMSTNGGQMQEIHHEDPFGIFMRLPQRQERSPLTAGEEWGTISTKGAKERHLC